MNSFLFYRLCAPEVVSGNSFSCCRAIDTGVVATRPDIALVYYPPTYDLFWFAARTIRSLQSQTDARSKFPVLDHVYTSLLEALTGAGSAFLLSSMQVDQKNHWAFWDDFLVGLSVSVRCSSFFFNLRSNVEIIRATMTHPCLGTTKITRRIGCLALQFR